MVSKTVKMANEEGFQMKNASEFITAMGQYSSKITIRFNGSEYNAKSLLNVIAAYIKAGSEFEIICDGDDEQEALAEAVALIENA